MDLAKNRLGYTITTRCGSRYTCASECASYIINRHCTQQRTWERSSFTAFHKDLAAPIYSLYYGIDEAEFRDSREKGLHEHDASCSRDATDIGRDTFIEKEPTGFNGHAISVIR